MLKISISKLEQARLNPKAFVASLNDVSKGFGSKGSFSGTFKTYIGKFHNEDVEKEKLYRQLHDVYKLQFVENPSNNRRTEKYCDAFTAYTEYMRKHDFGLDNFFTRIDLNVLSDVSLGGNSPILSSSEDRIMVFSIQENSHQWQTELKYPIFQKYLADNYYDCESGNVEIGVFNIENGQFELTTYNEEDIENAFKETKSILGIVKKMVDSK